ncbi:MAG: FAD-dependent oxidoreductase [Phycisphaeraceae bacterium]|nr:FAD-dependent oxidoreductase [Phycisphaeraceae bacterium]
MRKTYGLVFLAMAMALGCAPQAVSAQEKQWDVVIYGGTSAAVIAAVQVKKMDKTVVVVSPDKHLGGLSAGGLGWTDSGKKAAIGGLSRNFYQRIKKHYDDPKAWRQQKPSQYKRYRPNDDAMWVFEPHVAEKVFENLVAEYKIPVHRDQWLDRKKGVKKQGARIVSITTLGGKTYAGTMFIDGTYEGDLMAAAGVDFHVGREANSVYGETLNGVQTRRARSHQFRKKISPYWEPGNPQSGLLPRIQEGGPGEEGSGDHRVQAYNFRVCMTNAPSNRVPFPKPDGYDVKQYELLLRTLKAGSRHVFGKFDPAPNRKTDTNNHGSFSTDNIGMNYDYPTASYERRREIIKEHETYQKGYHYFLANDPRVPESIRKRYSQWGLPKDEFTDNGHWPHQIYVREARRMVGDFVVTELHLRRQKPTPRSIGMGSYNMDSHNVQRYVAKTPNGQAYVLNEGDIQVNPGGPYPIDYGAVLPKKNQADNLLVPLAVSSSHIAYGSIRMEPVFMILGQSAATAAVFSIEDNIAPQDLPYEKLKARLEADGQVLEMGRSSRRGSPPKPGWDPKKLEGIVVDDKQAKLAGNWFDSTSIRPYVGAGYKHDKNAADGKATATFTLKVPKPGSYKVRLIYPNHTSRATNIPVTIRIGDKTHTHTLNQQKPAPWWGPYDVEGTISITVTNAKTNQHVTIDAAQAVEAK